MVSLKGNSENSFFWNAILLLATIQWYALPSSLYVCLSTDVSRLRSIIEVIVEQSKSFSFLILFVAHYGHDVIIAIFISVAVIKSKNYKVSQINLSSCPLYELASCVFFNFIWVCFILEFKSSGGLYIIFTDKKLNSIGISPSNLRGYPVTI